MVKRAFVVAAVSAVCACTPSTEFTGAAFVPGGSSGCATKCQKEGLEMSAMVFMGEYSSACVCRAQKAASAPATPKESSDSEGANAEGAVAGVFLQMQAERAVPNQHR
jgi:hypothetical protein